MRLPTATRSYLCPPGGKNYDTNAPRLPSPAVRSYLCPVWGQNYDRWGMR